MHGGADHIHFPAVGAPELSVCLAGHPAPLLLRGDGGTTEVGAYGTVMGYTEHPELTETRVELGLGDVLLLYTDGLTEAVPPDGPTPNCASAWTRCPKMTSMTSWPRWRQRRSATPGTAPAMTSPCSRCGRRHDVGEAIAARVKLISTLATFGVRSVRDGRQLADSSLVDQPMIGFRLSGSRPLRRV